MTNTELVLKAKRRRGEDGNRVFSIRIREDIVKQLDAISERSGHSRNELIGLLLEFAIDNCRIED